MENASYLAQRHRDQDRMAEDWNFLTGLLVAGQSARGLPADGRPALPLTILSGFLGAGKTSLVNHVLAHPAGRRVLVLVNDFGAINIDEKLIAGRSAGTLALSNGCVCCSLAGDLSRKLAEIVSAADRPDAILLEASGLSDPHSLALVADTNPGIQLDGIITVIDAETIRAQYEAPLTAGLVGQQISGADLLILNKLDLLAEGERDAARAWLDARAAGRPIVAAVHARVPIEVVFSVDHEDRRGHEGGQAGREPSAAPRFEALNLSTDAALDRDRLTRMLRSLPGDVLRGKGVLRLADDPGRGAVYQRVGGRWSLTPGPRPESDVSSLVLIFPNDAARVDKAALAEQFEHCRQR